MSAGVDNAPLPPPHVRRPHAEERREKEDSWRFLLHLLGKWTIRNAAVRWRRRGERGTGFRVFKRGPVHRASDRTALSVDEAGLGVQVILEKKNGEPKKKK